MYLAGNSSNPRAAINARPAKRERRHVSTAATMHAQPHTKATSATRGEVSEVFGHAPENRTIAARPAARNTPASRIVLRGFLWAVMLFSSLGCLLRLGDARSL